jgi:DNA polymerase (family 10)
MAEAAHQMGWSFMGLSDHSKTAFYAKGLSEADIERQWKEVESLSKKMRGFKIFRGIESDILKDGALDYSDTFLKKFDFVIASIHSRYGMTEMTDRLLKALEHPRTTMLGHLTGRLLLEREGYAVNHSKIIEAAIKHRKIIELNAHPQRLDMDWRFLSEACKKGLLISINPDAHSTDGLKAVQFGVWMARKAGVPSKNILNTWSLPEISKFLSL